MIVLDTKVISEPLRPQSSPAVVAWLDAQVVESLYITSVNTAELWAGVATMPEGARKQALQSSLDALLERLFGARQLDFDRRAAMAYATLAHKAAAIGRPLSFADGLIAAIAHTHGFAVATRDVDSFRVTGIEVINPWEFAGRPSN